MSRALTPADLYIARRSTLSSQATARSALNAAARCLGRCDLNDLDWTLTFAEASIIRAGLNMLEPGWGKAVWSAVRQTVVIARSLRLVDAGTVTDILAIPGPRGGGAGLGRTPTDDEVADLLGVARADPTLRGRRDLAVLAVLAGCGLRRSEAASVDVNDWCPVSGRLTVTSGKGRRFRELPAPFWAADAIDDWLVEVDGGHLLRSVNRWGSIGGPISGHAINAIVARLANSAGTAPLTAHGLRRFAVTSVIRLGDLGLAQRYAGHAHVSTTITSYDARDTAELERVVRGTVVHRRPCTSL